MARVTKRQIKRTAFQGVLIAVLALSAVRTQAQDHRPIADAGLSRYAGPASVALDGTGSYDPDNSGTMNFVWRQIKGPSVKITGENTPTPTVGGFIQTNKIQECEFELVVSDGELTSVPDTVKVIIVPVFGENQLRLYNEAFNEAFDPDKPTILYFGGGDCSIGYTDNEYGRRLPFKSLEWTSKANILWFPDGYGPDSGVGAPSYHRYGDMLIVYLSQFAPNYQKSIQTSGWSTGGQPAIDVGIRLNLTYKDPRYAVNHVTLLDAAQYCRDYTSDIPTYLRSAVEGEQCWVDNYIATIAENHIITPRPSFPLFHDNVLNIVFDKYEDSSINWLWRHYLGNDWYGQSLSNPIALHFNSGIVGGAYWSVIGPGKNLQLASATGTVTYKFRWFGDGSSGYIDFCDESNHPGRLPEPVTLLGPTDGATIDANGVVLSCQASENAVGYHLLFGAEPDHLIYVQSYTSLPPNEPVSHFPFTKTWWTVKVHDKYGSTIFSDPRYIYTEQVVSQPIENVSQGKRYVCIQDAINDAQPGDEIVLAEGIFEYCESLNFKGKSLTLRSKDPFDSTVVKATVIRGVNQWPVATFSSGEDESCVLDGLTLMSDGSSCIYCYCSSPLISRCTIINHKGVALDLHSGSEPRLVDCVVVGVIRGPAFFVDDDGSNDRGPGDPEVGDPNEDGSAEHPFDSIQEAIDYVLPGDAVVILPGTYKGKGNRDLKFNGKVITVRSMDPNDSEIVASTAIDCQGTQTAQHQGFVFNKGESAQSVLAGLTITNAYGYNGGGISCTDSSSPAISKCVLKSNRAAKGGGGFYNQSGSPKITNCIFSDNTAESGGALYNSSNTLVVNCTFTKNSTTTGGGIHNQGGALTLINCILWNNTPAEVRVGDGTASIMYSDIKGSFTGVGNIATDPLFAGSANGDYHLKSRGGRWNPLNKSWVIDGITSLCIDAGYPTFSVGEEPQPNGGRINMGAYGGTREASKSP